MVTLNWAGLVPALLDGLSILFVLAPAVLAIGLIGHHYIALWGLIAWQSCALVLAVGPVPPVARTDTGSAAPTVLFTIFNFIAMATTIWIYRSLRSLPLADVCD